MGNAESTQDHYEVLGVHPQASGNRIDKAFRSAALKWHPVRRTPGAIDKAYRVLSDPIKRTAYNTSRGSGGKGNGKGLFFYTCIFVVGYVTYRLWRSGKLEEISQDVIKKIIDWATEVKDSDAALALQSQLASYASSVASASKDGLAKVEEIGLAGINKIGTIRDWATEVKDSDAASALGSKLVSSASSVASASKDGLSKVGEISLAGINKIGTITDWATEVKDSDAASALGSKLVSSATSVASASKDGLSKVSKWFQNK